MGMIRLDERASKTAHGAWGWGTGAGQWKYGEATYQEESRLRLGACYGCNACPPRCPSVAGSVTDGVDE